MNRVFIDLTHLGRHVTGIERVAIEQFEKVRFDGAELTMIRARGVVSMILKQQILLPLLALLYPRAQFAFPGFPPSPFFALISGRTILYVHDTFLLTRRADLSTKARLYMAPQFAIAVRHLKRFFVNSEKTARELAEHVRPDARILLYRPAVKNHFGLDASERFRSAAKPAPLKIVSMGTVEPRKNYAAALAIQDEIRANFDSDAELHIIGRSGWGHEGAAIAEHPGVTVHGYLTAEDVKAALEAADIYLCTSHDEGLGLPLLEAQFAGLPVAAPDQPVFREVLAQSGTFIRTENPAEAASAITALLSTPGSRQAWAERSMRNVERWNDLADDDFCSVRTIFAEDDRGVANTAIEGRA
jgi:glycosyltransferase involved in cell wall biosynthesis